MQQPNYLTLNPHASHATQELSVQSAHLAALGTLIGEGYWFSEVLFRARRWSLRNRGFHEEQPFQNVQKGLNQGFFHHHLPGPASEAGPIRKDLGGPQACRGLFS